MISTTSKVALREQLLVARSRLSPDERGRMSRAVCDRLVALEPFAGARTVALYAALGAEVDVGPARDAALASGKRVVYPRVVPGSRSMSFAACAAEALVRGPFRALEPPPGAAPVGSAEIDCIVVPGVAFDVTGHRLGRGGGYYDAVMAALPESTCRIGAGFELQIVDAIPAEEHDVRVDAVVTDTAVRWTAPGRCGRGSR